MSAVHGRRYGVSALGMNRISAYLGRPAEPNILPGKSRINHQIGTQHGRTQGKVGVHTKLKMRLPRCQLMGQTGTVKHRRISGSRESKGLPWPSFPSRRRLVDITTWIMEPISPIGPGADSPRFPMISFVVIRRSNSAQRPRKPE